MSAAEQRAAAPLIFGEVLFDDFEDGSRVLGGAPFNVAWHLQGFGLEPLFVSAVGEDDAGREVIDRMEEWGMRTGGVQTDSSHPTGRVTARIVDGEPVFEIGTEQAYDHVSEAEAVRSLDRADVPLMYHGTLALRMEASRQALAGLQRETDAPIFVDLNLRAPWWTHDLLRSCIERASWLKLNADELATVTGRGAETREACEDVASALARKHELAAVLVTLGAEGSLMVHDGRLWTGEPESGGPHEVVDTVGAGDAFSAVACVGLLRGWEPPEILSRGNVFAEELCRIRGATTTDRSLYERHLSSWRSA